MEETPLSMMGDEVAGIENFFDGRRLGGWRGLSEWGRSECKKPGRGTDISSSQVPLSSLCRVPLVSASRMEHTDSPYTTHGKRACKSAMFFAFSCEHRRCSCSCSQTFQQLLHMDLGEPKLIHCVFLPTWHKNNPKLFSKLWGWISILIL